MNVFSSRNMILCLIALGATGFGLSRAFAADEKKPTTPQGQVDAIVKSYLVIEKSLTTDKTDGVSDELSRMRAAATALGEGDAKVKDQAKAIAGHADAKPKDIKAARATFKTLSADITSLVQVMPPSAQVAPELYEVNCPMAKANWLQPTKDIANPYMGSEMLDCGKVERKVAPADKK